MPACSRAQQNHEAEAEIIKATYVRPKLYCGDDSFLSCMALLKGYSFFLSTFFMDSPFSDFMKQLYETAPQTQLARYRVHSFHASSEMTVSSSDPVVAKFCQNCDSKTASEHFGLDWQHYVSSHEVE